MLYLLATLINKKTNLRHKFFQEYKKKGNRGKGNSCCTYNGDVVLMYTQRLVLTIQSVCKILDIHFFSYLKQFYV